MEVYGETGEAITVRRDDLRVRRKGDDEERQQSAPALTAPYNDPISYLIAVVSGGIRPTGALFAVTVSNLAGSVTSNNAILTVR